MKKQFLLTIFVILSLFSFPTVVMAETLPTLSSGPIEGSSEGLFPQAIALWEQTSDGYNAIIDQFFPDFGAGVFSADDFTNTMPWNIEFIYVEGVGWYNPSLPNADSLNWYIFPDAGGVPAGFPGGGGQIWSHSCLPTSPEVTIGGANSDNVTLDIVTAQGTPLNLLPGTYWLAFYPSLNFGLYSQWFWKTSGTTNLSIAQVIDPSNLLGTGWTTWTPWTVIDSGTHDAAFSLGGTIPADLVVSYLSAKIQKIGSLIGRVLVQYRVKNVGDAGAGGSWIAFYLSKDTVLDASDVYLGDAYIPPLAPGQEAPLPAGTKGFRLNNPVFWQVPSTWYVIAVADAWGDVDESDETNNKASTVATIVVK